MDYSSTGYQANVNNTGAGSQVKIGGRWVGRTSPEATGAYGDLIKKGRAASAKQIAAANASEVAELDQQEVEDRIAENKSRNDSMTAAAFGNAQRGTQMGRGLFQRRQSGSRLASFQSSLSAGNASALKTARMKTLQAKQAADPSRNGTGSRIIYGGMAIPMA